MWSFILPPIVLLRLALPQERKDRWSHPMGCREITSCIAQSNLVFFPSYHSMKPVCCEVGVVRTMDACYSISPIPILRTVCPSKLWADFPSLG